jgi:hypothetical protein
MTDFLTSLMQQGMPTWRKPQCELDTSSSKPQNAKQRRKITNSQIKQMIDQSFFSYGKH